jgi:hypothetical protein
VADERFEPEAVTGRTYDSVGLDTCAIGEAYSGPIEGLDAAHDLDPPFLDRRDDLLVDDRRDDAESVQASEDPTFEIASARRTGRCINATAIMSPEIGPGPSRRVTFSGVRTESQTFAASPSARL